MPKLLETLVQMNFSSLVRNNRVGTGLSGQEETKKSSFLSEGGSAGFDSEVSKDLDKDKKESPAAVYLWPRLSQLLNRVFLTLHIIMCVVVLFYFGVYLLS